ncbi:RsmE family RNA methyltransferase [Pseudobutyrivibrio xylanivorans]|uniref:Ribosomal RNA small subunit methyltransferase E n=1 Tax=Pseudobutyrivibrio xylanivorans TaxID=185007 RepID=A0A5P6VW08_PSEXY|nr:RsmE family RNA methyltransferase [Pseudobutyrivibrio xylanivorans]QFJ55741.1 16S rRNA (uracil(1498)-N(3))-methyltransferase [Pseudobutyrivibrio xylanivorans]
MQQVFVNESPVDGKFNITGNDAHHLTKVVRLRPGERIRVSVSDGSNYICEVTDYVDKDLVVNVVEEVPSTELPNRIYLFQAIPKGDRMETIIEKCVELGVFEIIPVEMKNCIVKLDDKKKKSKVERYQSIAKSAAEQSKRSIIPNVHAVMSFKEAFEYAKSLDVILLPFESKNGMQDTYDMLDSLEKGQSIGVFIGPEGGFAPSEIEMVQDSVKLISLGHRILRTDTAAICSLAMLMLKCEEF